MKYTKNHVKGGYSVRAFLTAMKQKMSTTFVAKLLVLGITLSIAAVGFAPAVHADNTYIITDGDTVIVHVSASAKPQKVIEEAGLHLGYADKYTTIETTGGKTEINIQRVQTIAVNCDGRNSTYATYGDTVGNILKALKIELGENDRTSYALTDPTFDGMAIDVIRVSYKTLQYEEVIPAETTYYEDPSLAPGETLVLQTGRDGKVNRTASVTYENGREVSREILSENVIVGPTKGIALCGPGSDNGATGTSRTISCLGTAYSCDGRPGITATGTIVHLGTVAVDPKVIPLGSKLFITSDDGQYVYGYATAEDTGGLIKGNRVDLYYNTTAECFQFGARRVTVRILKG